MVEVTQKFLQFAHFYTEKIRVLNFHCWLTIHEMSRRFVYATTNFQQFTREVTTLYLTINQLSYKLACLGCLVKLIIMYFCIVKSTVCTPNSMVKVQSQVTSALKQEDCDIVCRWYLSFKFDTSIVCLPLKDFYYCLLYTSPSPRDATLSRMPSSA